MTTSTGRAADSLPLSRSIAAALARQGVRHVFGLMGSGNLRLVHSLAAEHEIPFHNARHEAQAVAAADGYARASGEVGVCLVTQGPGLTNTLTPLVTAQRARSPLVLISGDSTGVSSRERPFPPLQAIDQARVLAAAEVPTVRLAPEAAAAETARAFSRARELSGPVALGLPVELEGAGAASANDFPPVGSADELPLEPSPDEVRLAADLLERAERPVVLAGLGAARAGARELLIELADHVGALLTTTVRGIGLFNGHPRNAGVSGGFSSPSARALLAQADCVTAFGASLNNFTIGKGTLYSDASLIHCDHDPGAFGRHHHDADLHVLGDAHATAAALLDELRARRRRATGYGDDPNLGDLDPRWPLEVDESDESGVDPRVLCRQLDELLPRARTVVTDGGHFCMFPPSYMTFDAPESLVFPLEFGATGGGLGAAIGAAYGAPERLSVLFIGDGGLLMTLGDLDLAVRDRIPMLIVCMNDRAYGSEIRQLDAAGIPRHYAEFPTPDLAAVARSLGADAFTVTSVRDLEGLPPRLRSLDGPLFIDCLINPNVVSDVLRHT